MLAFIRSQRAIVERILQHIETPAIVDLLVRIMQLDEHTAGMGVLEVCHCPQSTHGRTLITRRPAVALQGAINTTTCGPPFTRQHGVYALRRV